MAAYSIVLPGWLDQVPQLDWSPERDLLTELETWAIQEGWRVTDGRELPSELKLRTDVLLEDPTGKSFIRIAVVPKRSSGSGLIRLDFSNLKTVELVYRPRSKKWRVELGAVPIEDDVKELGWKRLFDLMFKR